MKIIKFRAWDKEKIYEVETIDKPITLGSMQKAILELNAWSKINRMKKSGIKPVLYVKKGYYRPKWLIDLCKNENIKIKRTQYIENGKAYLLDEEMYRFYFKKDYQLKTNYDR